MQFVGIYEFLKTMFSDFNYCGLDTLLQWLTGLRFSQAKITMSFNTTWSLILHFSQHKIYSVKQLVARLEQGCKEIHDIIGNTWSIHSGIEFICLWWLWSVSTDYILFLSWIILHTFKIFTDIYNSVQQLKGI